MGVGARIKAILKEKQMTIKELSEKTSIPVNTLYSITKRDEQNVRSDNLKKIADSLSVDVDYLLSGDQTGLANTPLVVTAPKNEEELERIRQDYSKLPEEAQRLFREFTHLMFQMQNESKDTPIDEND